LHFRFDLAKIKTLVCVETVLWRDSIDLVGAARCFVGKEANEVYAFTLNLDNTEAEAAIGGAFDVVIRARDERILPYDAPGIACFVARLQAEYGFDCVLFPASTYGRVLAPKAAARLQCALCANVVKIEHEEGVSCANFILPVFDAKMFAAVRGIHGNGKPVMASIRAGLFIHIHENAAEGKKRVSANGCPRPRRLKAQGLNFLPSARRWKPATYGSRICLSG
jgi:electron transfer flavoprotein alpha subunit